MSFLVRLVSCGAAVLVAVALVPGLAIVPGGRAGTTLLSAAGVGAVFGLLNAGSRRGAGRPSHARS